MHYYSFHIGDFRSETQHLSNAEELAYRRAIDWYYDKEQPLPLDVQWLARRLRVEVSDLQTALDDFFLKTGEGWIHSRCEEEIAAYHGKAEIAKANGKLGGRPRKQQETDNKPTGLPLGYQKEPSGNLIETISEANQEPITNNHKPISSQSPLVIEESWPVDNFVDDDSGKKLEKPPPQSTVPGQFCAALRPLGVDVQPANPIVLAWEDDGFALEALLLAVERARTAKPKPERIPARYLDTVLRNMALEAKKQPRAPPDNWWTSNPGIERKGRELGLHPRGSESYNDFKDRIFEKINQQQSA